MDDVIGAADCVLFDFDGPMCKLFHGHPAPLIARRMRELLAARGALSALGPGPRETEDPQILLRAMEPGSELAALLEELLTEEELRATKSALPTAHADALVHALTATGRRVAITTNNGEDAVRSYLHGRGLAHHFTRTVHGRLPDVSLLKPHPDCLERALAATRTAPDRALMIGDTMADLQAAEAAGVPFLGYAPDDGPRAALLRKHAPRTVASLEEVLTVVISTPSFR